MSQKARTREKAWCREAARGCGCTRVLPSDLVTHKQRGRQSVMGVHDLSMLQLH